MKLTGNFSETAARMVCESVVNWGIEKGELPREARKLAIDELMKVSSRSVQIDVDDDRISDIWFDVVG